MTLSPSQERAAKRTGAPVMRSPKPLPEVGRLLDKYPGLPGDKEVARALIRERREGLAVSDSKQNRVGAYLRRWDRLADDAKGARRLARRLKEAVVLDTDEPGVVQKVAGALRAADERLAIREGRGGDLRHVPEDRVREAYERLVFEKRDAQLTTLDPWLAYLKANDAGYPVWFRYLTLRALTRMGHLDAAQGTYTKRGPTTVAPLPELNAEALAWVHRALQAGAGAVISAQERELRVGVPAADVEAAVKAVDFSRLYALAQAACARQSRGGSLRGEWVKYPRGSNHRVLEAALAHKGTGWCTASGSAASQLSGGDFYVYFTAGADGRLTEPRIAIRMEGERVAEVRGVDPSQHVEPALIETAQMKYRQLPGGDTFDKKAHDMRELTRLVDKHARGDAFGPAELRFLYELDGRIEGFGYGRDPRIEELRAKRERRADFATIFGCEPEQVVSSGADINETTRLVLGDISPSDVHALADRVGGLMVLGKADLSGTELTRLPEGMVFYGAADFSGCTRLTAVPPGTVFRGGVSFEKSGIATIPAGTTFGGSADFSDTPVSGIPSGVSFKGAASFVRCGQLTSIASGTVFGAECSFAHCTALRGIPDAVVFKGLADFSRCSSLQSISPGASFEQTVWFPDCVALRQIPAGWTFRGHACFSGCTALESIPDGTTFVGLANFQGAGLTTIGSNVIFGDKAEFLGCASLQRVGAGVVFKGEVDFRDCTNLVELAASAKFHDWARFAGCSSLRTFSRGARDAAARYQKFSHRIWEIQTGRWPPRKTRSRRQRA